MIITLLVIFSLLFLGALFGAAMLVAAIYFDELFDKVFNAPWTD